MAWLKFYTVERERFPEAFNTEVSDEKAQKIVKKLLRHFLPKNPKSDYLKHPINVCFRGNGGSVTNIITGRIKLPHEPSVGQICHASAHIINYAKYGNSNHNKKLLQAIGQLIAYAKKKKYWKDEKND